MKSNSFSILHRRVAEVIERDSLEKKLNSGKKLRVKLGIDPTGARLHLGHAVPLWKLREFQEAGHAAILIVGDWTAMIGDPSGKDATRPSLTRQEVDKNAKDYFRQAFLILDKKKTETHLQSEWYKKFGLADIIRLTSMIPAREVLSHDTFRRRLKNDYPLSFHELLYPLLQGYDSFVIRSDVEVGALEQKFNVLMGRRVQRILGQASQDVVLLPYLIGLDGKEKMGKSVGNYIALDEQPGEMFGKVMSLLDELIVQYFELCTDISDKELIEMRDLLKQKSVNPRDLKIRLGREIVKIYHGDKKSREATENFERKFGKAEGEIKPDFVLRKKPGEYSITELLVEGKLAASKSEARRKIAEGAVSVDGGKILTDADKVQLKKKSLIRLGKRFLRVG